VVVICPHCRWTHDHVHHRGAGEITDANDRWDVAVYGRCWCGRPRRAQVIHDGDTASTWLGCDAGHEAEWWDEATTP
jgi:hypothetical protein